MFIFNKEINIYFMTDQDIINYFWEGHKFIKKQKLINISKDILDYLNNRYNDSLSILETINRIKLNIEIHPICPICNKNLVVYKGRFLSKNIFQSTCNCKECRNKYKGFKSTLTKLERYGNSTYNNSNQMKQTKLERYGNSGYHNIAKMKETNLKKYGTENVFCVDIFKDKIKQTKLERYGDENFNNMNKHKQTCLKRYGNENYTNRELAVKNTNYIIRQQKIKETNLEKYGTENVFCVDIFKDKIKQTKLEKYGDEKYTNRIKFKQTMIIKYNVESPLQSNIIKNKLNYKEIVKKSFITKTKNNSFNKSNPEDNIYNLLITKFKEVKRQYKSDKYPYHCDFYIPEIDLYIEYQGFWTHGDHPYDNQNINDNKLLIEWENKNTGFYKNAINVWTISDINKRKIAKENNLNWIEFFSIKDFYKWFNNI